MAGSLNGEPAPFTEVVMAGESTEVKLAVLSTKMEHLQSGFTSLSKTVQEHMEKEEEQRRALEKRLNILLACMFLTIGSVMGKDAILRLISGLIT